MYKILVILFLHDKKKKGKRLLGEEFLKFETYSGFRKYSLSSDWMGIKLSTDVLRGSSGLWLAHSRTVRDLSLSYSNFFLDVCVTVC